MDGQIVRQSSSYRQGLVLGLTMAEILILLVFCLLIALTTFLQVEQQKRKEAEHLLGVERTQNVAYRAAVDAAKDNPSLVEKLRDAVKSSDPEKIDKLWRELVESHGFVTELKDKGLTVTDVRSQLTENQKLRSKGLDADRAIRDADTLAAIRKAMPDTPDAALAPNISNAKASGMQVANPAGHRWPPIINLSDAKGYRFKSGSAELSPEFRQSLREDVPGKILALMKEFDVDVIEVVGHTDEQPIGVRQSNLDRELTAVLRNNADVSRLIPADNAGLGLSRAVAVASVLLTDSSLALYKVIPLSGAQLIRNDETLATDNIPANDRERRRIEIRLRKSMPSELAPSERIAPTPVPTPVPRPQRPSQRSNSIETRPLGAPLSIAPGN